jgi:hypothetical protein
MVCLGVKGPWRNTKAAEGLLHWRWLHDKDLEECPMCRQGLGIHVGVAAVTRRCASAP